MDIAGGGPHLLVGAVAATHIKSFDLTFDLTPNMASTLMTSLEGGVRTGYG